MGAAIGNTRRIQLKRGWNEPPIIWAVIVGESGTLKTPAFKLAMRSIRDRQNEALQQHAKEQAQYEIERLRYEKELLAWKRSKKSEDDPPEKPEPPQAVRYIISDTTVEGLIPILSANPRGVLLGRDEVVGWLGSFDRYSAGRGGADAANWLSMHNGEEVVVDRKTGHPRTLYVPSASVSVTGGAQPGVLNRVLGREHRESGLLARLLMAMPPRLPKRWTEAEIPERLECGMKRLFDRLFELEPDHDEEGESRPRVVTLTPEAKRAWVRFYNEHAEVQAGLTGDLAAAWSKLEGYAARLALVVHLTRWAAGDPTLKDADRVDEVSIAAGVALVRWFGGEARRIYGVMAESDEDRDRRALVDLIEQIEGAVTPREVCRSSKMFKTAAEAESALADLVGAGFGQWEQAPPGRKGGRPSKRFVLASADDGNAAQSSDAATDVDNTPAGDLKNEGIVNVDGVDEPQAQSVSMEDANREAFRL